MNAPKFVPAQSPRCRRADRARCRDHRTLGLFEPGLPDEFELALDVRIDADEAQAALGSVSSAPRTSVASIGLSPDHRMSGRAGGSDDASPPIHWSDPDPARANRVGVPTDMRADRVFRPWGLLGLGATEKSLSLAKAGLSRSGDLTSGAPLGQRPPSSTPSRDPRIRVGTIGLRLVCSAQDSVRRSRTSWPTHEKISRCRSSRGRPGPQSSGREAGGRSDRGRDQQGTFVDCP